MFLWLIYERMKTSFMILPTCMFSLENSSNYKTFTSWKNSEMKSIQLVSRKFFQLANETLDFCGATYEAYHMTTFEFLLTYIMNYHENKESYKSQTLNTTSMDSYTNSDFFFFVFCLCCCLISKQNSIDKVPSCLLISLNQATIKNHHL